VSAGQSVGAGQQLGEAGARGNAPGCHLHFEVHLHNGSIYGSDNVNPSQWLVQNASRAEVALGG
jgi:murein DD-endopeptidase MepM/ murein hydrolase activator NlpD